VNRSGRPVDIYWINYGADLAWKLRAEEVVILSGVVRPDGSATDLKVKKSAGYGLDEEAPRGRR
jgi:hypothetical protein